VLEKSNSGIKNKDRDHGSVFFNFNCKETKSKFLDNEENTWPIGSYDHENPSPIESKMWKRFWRENTKI